MKTFGKRSIQNLPQVRWHGIWIFLCAAVITFTASGAEPLADSAQRQIAALQSEKESRTPAQRKMDSQLVYAVKTNRNEVIAAGVPLLTIQNVEVGAGGAALDIKAAVTPELLAYISAHGGTVLNNFSNFNAIRATLPLDQIEALAARSDVNFVQPAVKSIRHIGTLTSEGDITHGADQARTRFGVDGTGVKVGVISDSVDFLAQSQASGDLGPVTVLTGQSGVPATGEGTAMLEIVHDLAPGADLFFATADISEAGFAQNILNLRSAGCDIIVDDVFYFDESPFQDGVIAQAVNTVTANGALYFSAAGNEGNIVHGTGGTWQGDFVDGGAAGTPVSGKGGRVHAFGTNNFDTVTSVGFAVVLFWSDPMGASTNDYDLYILDSAGANIVGSSTTVQNGSQDPFEITGATAAGQQVVVVLASGTNRFLHIDTIRGNLAVATTGNIKGHSAAVNAFSVAAVDAATSYPSPFVGGTQNPVESFSSDGPRRVFYQANGTPITPGDFSATGGTIRQKPDIAAADGVQTTVPGFNPFFGTSAAAPHAAAIAALLKAYNSDLTPAQIRNFFTNSALDIEGPAYDINSGAGLTMANFLLQTAPPGVPKPRLVVSTNFITGGNGNRTVDVNECNNLFLVLANSGNADATGVRVTLSTTTPGVSLGARTSSYPNIVVQGIATNSTPFTISTSPLFVCGTPIRLTVLIKSDQITETNSVVLQTGVVGPPISFDGVGLPLPIPDANLVGVSSIATVSGMVGALKKATVSLFLSHTFDADLTISLVGPDGTSVVLASADGGSGDNFGLSCSPSVFRTTFDDDAPASIVTGIAPFQGSYKPLQGLGAFVGKSGGAVNGAWQLKVVDSIGIDVGVLQCWSLQLFATECQDGGGGCPGADLAIGMTDLPDPVFVGGNLIYTTTVTNLGPGTAKNAAISQHIPNTTIFVSAVPSQGSTVFSSGDVVANLGNLPFGGVATLTVTVAPTTAAVIGSTATASSSEPDPDTANNSVFITTRVNAPTADLVAGISAAPNPILVGGVLTYAVAVTNNGPSSASFVTLSNTLPAGVLVQSAFAANGTTLISGNTVVFSFGLLASGARATGTIVVIPFVTGPIQATTTASAVQPDPVLANNTASATTVVGAASDLGISVQFMPDPVVNGNDLTAVVLITNRGPSVASSVVVNGTLPNGVGVISTTPSQGTVNFLGNTFAGDIGSLGIGASAQITFHLVPTNSGPVTLIANVAAQQGDPNPADNTASATTLAAPPFVSILAAGATLTAESDLPADGALEPGETVTVQLRLRNAGNVANTNLVATLLSSGGVTAPSGSQNYDVLPPGSLPVARPFSFTVGAGSSGGVVTATLALQDGTNMLDNVSFSFVLPTVQTFANTNLINILDNTNADPYPSSIIVSGVTGLVGKVTVTLNKFNHTFPEDVDVLLVGPLGQKAILMSDSGGGNAAVDASLTFDADAVATLDDGQIISGTYVPVNADANDLFNAPAPPGPYDTALSVFNGPGANGVWSLFVMDDFSGDAGAIAEGWNLSLSTVSPVNQVADLNLAGSAAPNPVLLQSQITFSFVITNAGPNTTTGIGFTNPLPAGAVFVSATSSQGVLTTNAMGVTGNLGSLSVGAAANVWVIMIPTIKGPLTNRATIGAVENDLNPANNAVSMVVDVIPPVADVGVTGSVTPNPGVTSSNLTYSFTVTNRGPEVALNVILTDPLPLGVAFGSATSTAGTVINSSGTVVANIGSLAANGSATVELVVGVPVAGVLTNVAVLSTSSSDTNAADNTVVAVVTVNSPAPVISAAGAHLTAESLAPGNGVVDSGETVTLGLSLQNVGSANTADLVATLLPVGGVTAPSGPQHYGALAFGGSAVSQPFTFTATGGNGGVVTATLSLADGTNSLGVVTFNFLLPATVSFTNPGIITIPERGPATPYPSIVNVSGMTGLVSSVKVTLRNLTHGFPDDLDMLLVSPNGRKVKIMSDVGGGHSLSNITITLDDAASLPLPDSDQIISGIYQPTDIDGGDIFPPPAPSGEAGSFLAAFGGSNPNGSWSLYITDDTTGDGGLVSGGWSLDITSVTTVNPQADVSVAVTSPKDTVFVGDVITYDVTVTNNGPQTASGVRIVDILPIGSSLVSSSTSQGGPPLVGGFVAFNLGDIAAGGWATLTINIAPTVGALAVNQINLTSDTDDLNGANNSAVTTTTVRVPARARFVDEGLVGGLLEMSLVGEPGLRYALQGSTDLTSWTSLSTNTAAISGNIKFTDSSGMNYRFYRAVRVLP